MKHEYNVVIDFFTDFLFGFITQASYPHNEQNDQMIIINGRETQRSRTDASHTCTVLMLHIVSKTIGLVVIVTNT
jgi:hypothetical protein